MTEEWIDGISGLALLVAGGYAGGTLAFIYCVRVIGRRDIRLLDAIIPWRAEAAAGGDVAGSDQAGETASGRRA